MGNQRNGRWSSPVGEARIVTKSKGTALVTAARDRSRRLPRAVGYVYGPRVASWLRKRWVLLRHPHADIRFGTGTYLGPGFSLFIPESGAFLAGDGVEFRRDFRAEVSGNGRIRIGDGCSFTYSVVLQCTTSMDIGDRCIFAQSATVFDGEHRFRDLDRGVLQQGYEFTPMRVGDDAFVGAKATVMAPVGTRAVVGANAVVTRPVPPYTVTVGAPARPIEYFGPPGEAPET